MKLVPTLELELLLLCARMRIDPDVAQRISLILRRGLDWDGFVMLARRHGLIPFLYRTLSSLGSGNAPPELLGRLRSSSEVIRFRALVMVRELLSALQALEAAGVTAVPYKGPALAACLYGDFTLRQFVDLDLLVKSCDALRARRVLLEHGFISKRQIPDRAMPAYVRFHCEFSFTSLEEQVLVELNWRVTPWYWRMPEIPDTAWTRLGRLSVVGVSVPWFAPEDLFFVLCLHGCKHKWATLKWLVDIAELLRTYPDLNWREMMDNARRTGAERILALGLFLAKDLLDAPVPADLLGAIRAKPSVESLAAEVCDGLFAANRVPIDTFAELRFVARASERVETKLFCRALIPAYFLLHRVVRPVVAGLRRIASSLSGATSTRQCR